MQRQDLLEVTGDAARTPPFALVMQVLICDVQLASAGRTALPSAWLGVSV